MTKYKAGVFSIANLKNRLGCLFGEPLDRYYSHAVTVFIGVKKEEEGKNAQGGSRTRTLFRIEDFLTHYHFRDQLALFGVWTMPSPCTEVVRREPSRLYTLPKQILQNDGGLLRSSLGVTNSHHTYDLFQVCPDRFHRL